MIIKHEIMFKHGFLRPKKSQEYVPWTQEDLDNMVHKTSINDYAVLQFKQIILAKEAGRDWMRRQANQLCISSDDPPKKFENAYNLWIGGNTKVARKCLNEGFTRGYVIHECVDFSFIPNAMVFSEVLEFNSIALV